MGFVGVFAGAANTPISSSLMAIELFGPEAGSFAAIACVASYLFSGHSGIYRSQRVGNSKHNAFVNREGYSLARLGPSHRGIQRLCLAGGHPASDQESYNEQSNSVAALFLRVPKPPGSFVVETNLTQTAEGSLAAAGQDHLVLNKHFFIALSADTSKINL